MLLSWFFWVTLGSAANRSFSSFASLLFLFHFLFLKVPYSSGKEMILLQGVTRVGGNRP